MSNTSEIEDVVGQLLAGSPTMFLSTASDDHPWGAGVFFAERELFELLIILETRGRTLANIRQNPHVAVVVSDGNPFAPFLQGAATAVIIDESASVAAVTKALVAKAPQIEPFLDAPMTAVRLNVSYWRATDVVNGWFPGKELFADAPAPA